MRCSPRFRTPITARAFAPESCKRASLRAGPRSIAIAKDAAAAAGLFRRSTFWDTLMAAAAGASYAGYSYREQADRFVRELSAADSAALQSAAASLPRGGFRDQLDVVTARRSGAICRALVQ